MKPFRSKDTPTLAAPPYDGHGDGASAAPADVLAEMSFLDHLEELRWALLKGLGGLVVATIACSFFSQWIIDEVLLGPATGDFFMYKLLGIQAETLELQNRTLPGQFFVHLGTIISVGLVVGSPVFVYSLWKFVEPGLYPDERHGLRFASAFATLFFILGILFGYLIISTMAVQFFSNYQISEAIRNDFDITKYFSMIVGWSFGTGVLFELPVVVYFLARLGVVTPAFLRASRKYALIVTLILGAFFTPPDPISQVLVALPLLALYELSIVIAAGVEKRRRRAELRAQPPA